MTSCMPFLWATLDSLCFGNMGDGPPQKLVSQWEKYTWEACGDVMEAVGP